MSLLTIFTDSGFGIRLSGGKLDFTCGVKLDGEFLITLERDGVPVKVVRAHNIITSAGQGLIGDMLRDVDEYDTGLTYCAIGTTTSEPLTSQTALAAEVLRREIQSDHRIGSVVTWTTRFFAAETPYTILEVGMFGHNTANGTANTGIMFDRATIDFNNGSALYDIAFEYRLTLS